VKRYIIDKFVKWKNSPERKPLIVYGARQVGKTWLVKEFANTHFKGIVALDFFQNPEYGSFFEQGLDPEKIIKAIEVEFKLTINPKDTLIFFDEIQECQRAKDSLKYFADLAPEYHIVSAGSYLGLAEGKFPVGKVDSLTMYPMSFYEFLEAIDRVQLLEAIKERDIQLLNSLSALLTTTLKTYFYVGGMPEVVGLFVKYDDLAKVRVKQTELLKEYRNDFTAHIPQNSKPSVEAKIRMLWDAIPMHLAREKKKFMYKDIKSGGRASEFEDAMEWLVNAGLVYKIKKTFTPKIPLDCYQEKDIFKLYMLDVGLLCAKANIDVSTFYQSDNSIFSDFQGALAEQYVLQELKQICENPIYYWGRDKGEAEVDFIMQYKNEIIPIEVKSARNTQSKSLDIYIGLEKPKYAIKLSMKNYGINGNLHSVPLYMVSSFADIINGN
jgi:hypothetical protein